MDPTLFMPKQKDHCAVAVVFLLRGNYVKCTVRNIYYPNYRPIYVPSKISGRLGSGLTIGGAQLSSGANIS
jgi:hypothetical protein